MDVHDPKTRSKNMAAIKSRNTKPEVKLRHTLFKHGLRYRINLKIPGKPDIVFPGKKIAIFVDGCFWHKCPLCYREPATNQEFWHKKISSNVKRDQEVNGILARDGWTVLRFWEHQVKKEIDKVADIIISHVRAEGPQLQANSLEVAEKKRDYVILADE